MGGHSTILSTPLQPWGRFRSGTTICVIHTLRSNSIVTRFLWEQQEPFQSFSRLPESSLPSMRRLSKGCCTRLCKPLRNWKQRREGFFPTHKFSQTCFSSCLGELTCWELPSIERQNEWGRLARVCQTSPTRVS